jgi:hypothetical protein
LSKIIRFADIFGISASALCLIHCLGMPFVLTLAPIVGLAHFDETVHQAMVVLVTLPVLLALIPGFSVHRRLSTLALGVLGLVYFIGAVLLIGPHYGETAEIAFSIIGGAHLIAAHWRNRRLCRVATVNV